MKLTKRQKIKIIIGLITILWGIALLVYGPFYSRGFLVPRQMGILVIIVGGCYILFDLFKKYENKK